ncbi:hypothetical protein SI65_08909 [Aspergillus cristatus]|uniref:Uncharacterized protein n=1 Tax=Aspergillus cristatus TaxID=573508 RepID=A0A1E3B3X6_ASPCR|nr:hypothetical protein SI65_08909 [Aspergillus cristatus]
MSASATENGAANTKLTDAYPRDVIIQYIFKPTMVDHPIVTTVITLLIIILYTWNCDLSLYACLPAAVHSITFLIR